MNEPPKCPVCLKKLSLNVTTQPPHWVADCRCPIVILHTIGAMTPVIERTDR
jgi:hypothetical protein